MNDMLSSFKRKVLRLFLFQIKNICSGYSLEAPRRGASNEYPQHIFSWRNKKNSLWLSPPLLSGDMEVPKW